MAERERVVDTACTWVRPIWISRDDTVTDGTARQLLAHNRAVVAACPELTP